MAWLSRLLWALAALVLFFFAALAVNQDSIALKFLVWQTPEVSVFWWLLAAFLLGLLLGLVGMVVGSARSGLKRRRLQHQLSASEKELHKLKGDTAQR